ncbi:hypothetical protein H8N03_06525 [Ramlibacter sp. USB13]|uniref:Uncharacterized protein n=1 Tax=Ramlibacter cellulosilyticus TaxID=2764187 RepID=A0A923SAT5_9BURK|nr:hypothetical protein [Ramlibacter cellulosilyticus]MBC5782593.1 hypothetical protein [Ramlibacter cellulosilyticus]
METRNEQPAQPLADWFHPLAGWEAASRWNRATFDWMAKGWQQWVALVTTVPPHFMVPPTLPADDAPRQASRPRVRGEDMAPVASDEPQRIVTRRKATAKSRKRSRG